mmetsp:Transcript_32330/g.59787  ORF Transcript_32330/g.59787 Transcript_32330/m.59787 type:complete len:672 (+) Transcript_32330:81-2096(+)|eukprot:CAMPEP_0202020640 /NCGR_PEP_ID=MMETSP0905-20130828/44923_1 /ASSEMBLY_ACC=CAM_ASM_000554 /TAXON_ID=420261 /ORGANISM="Thalassiosira antarctica, Strain CCMP982" /LENGTH=671 /DNA_ID=CAMNT_0048582269 /DNA_START=48 /DNA_END=2063 /DNA_ORIENTATION=+
MQSHDLEPIIKDIDISPLVHFFPQKCLSCCRFYQESNDDDKRSVGSDNDSFSELTQRLITSQGGEDGTTAATLEERNAHRKRIRQRPTLINKNIFLYFLLRFLQGTADSLWRGTILSIFVVQIASNPNGRSDYFRFAGYLEGMFGLGKIIATMLYPDEIINGGRNNVQSSRQQRQQTRDENNHIPGPGRQNSFTLKCAGMILVATAIANIILLVKLSNQQDYLFYQLLMPILLSYGYSTSVMLSSSASHALLRQSTATSNNEKRYKAIERPLVFSSNMVGPLISIFIFGAVGNAYTIRNLRMVWYVGCGLEMFVGILSLGFSDRYYVIPEAEEEEDASVSQRLDSPRGEAQDLNADNTDVDNGEDEMHERELRLRIDRFFPEEETLQATADASTAQESVLDESPLIEPLLPLDSDSTLEGDAAAIQTESDNAPSSITDSINANTSIDRHNSSRTLSLLPAFLSVIFALLFVAGSALFQPYWPVFFKDIPQLPPIQLQTLYVIIPFTIMLCDAAFRKFFRTSNISYRLGINMAVRLLGAMFVILIGTVSYWGSGGSSIALAIVFILRMAFVGFVEKAETRVFAEYFVNTDTPQWKHGMDMAQMIVWSVCAAVGGVLVESKSQADSGYGSGSGGGGYGYVLRLTGLLEFFGVVFVMIAMFFRRYGIGVNDTNL